MKVTIAILFSTTNPREISYKDSYNRLSEFATHENVDIRFVLGTNAYHNGKFSSYWQFKDRELMHHPGICTADLVYVRNRIQNIHFTLRVNDAYIEEISRDKFKTFQIFPNYVKKTVLISSDDLSHLEKLHTKLIVIKTRYGANGKNVHVVPREMIHEHLLADNEYIAQEFIDSSEGINNLTSGKHELRIFIFNGIPSAAYIRTPAPDSYISNISQGGKEQLINMQDIPESALTLAKAVDKKFTHVPRIYAIDIMYENGKPWVVELNDNPGMPNIKVQPFTDDYLRTLIKFLKEMVQQFKQI